MHSKTHFSVYAALDALSHALLGVITRLVASINYPMVLHLVKDDVYNIQSSWSSPMLASEINLDSSGSRAS